MRWLLPALLVAAAAPAQELCGSAKDLVVRALERIARVEDGLQLLKHACEQCPELGDAWYYRSLFERKLGHAQQAEYALKKAKLLGSEALEVGADPFTPSTRPVPGEKFTPVVRDKWAVVIGISRYRDRRLRLLPYSAKDARDFAGLLTDPRHGKFKPANVRVLTDGDATTVRVKTELNWLARTAAPEDLAVVYLSAHGSRREKDIAGVNYILTHDTDVSSPDTLYATAYPMVEAADIVRTRTKARKAAVFLDVCHSGGAMASVSQATLERMSQGVGRVIMSSSRADEVSWENDNVQNGYFTYYLMEALRAGAGTVPLLKLYESVRQQVTASVAKDRNVSQTPVVSVSDYGADLILGADTSR